MQSAAARLKNLECVIRLVEYGAQLRASDNEGTRAIDLIHDLDETQKRLCQSSVTKFLDTGSAEALTFVVRFASNPELTNIIVAKLNGKPMESLVEVCRKEPDVAPYMVADLINALFPAGENKLKAADSGLIAGLFPLVQCPVSVYSGSPLVFSQVVGACQHGRPGCTTHALWQWTTAQR